jgi:hypothetical protein
MKFAKVVFIAGGVWGIAALAPFYWLVDISGRRYAAPIDYPQFFWGFFSVALAWQFALVCLSTHWIEPRAIPTVDAAGDRREVRLRRDAGAAARPGTHCERRRRGRHPRRGSGPFVRRCVRRNLV